MRFLSFAKGDTPSAKTSWGAITDEGIIDLGSRMHCDFKQALTSRRLEEAKLLAAELSPDTDVADIIYLPPVEDRLHRRELRKSKRRVQRRLRSP